MSIPRELAQARHLELLQKALEMSDQRVISTGPTLGSLSRDRLIAFILEHREKRERHCRRMALELAERDEGLSRRFKQQTTEFMDQNDELLRRLADG